MVRTRDPEDLFIFRLHSRFPNRALTQLSPAETGQFIMMPQFTRTLVSASISERGDSEINFEKIRDEDIQIAIIKKRSTLRHAEGETTAAHERNSSISYKYSLQRFRGPLFGFVQAARNF